MSHYGGGYRGDRGGDRGGDRSADQRNNYRPEPEQGYGYPPMRVSSLPPHFLAKCSFFEQPLLHTTRRMKFGPLLEAEAAWTVEGKCIRRPLPAHCDPRCCL